MAEEGANQTDAYTFLPFEYLSFANQFHSAFHELAVRPPPFSWPRYFLLCHSIELALKAFLLHRGATLEELKAFDLRHNLKQLVTLAVEKGLHLKSETQAAISALTDAHSEYWPRYPKAEGLGQFYPIEQFAPAAGELLNAVSMQVLGQPAALALSRLGRMDMVRSFFTKFVLRVWPTSTR
jgi:hypothetical protein